MKNLMITGYILIIISPIILMILKEMLELILDILMMGNY